MKQTKQFKKKINFILIFFFLLSISSFIIIKSPGFKGSILDELLVIFDKKSFSHQFKGKVSTPMLILKDLINIKNYNLSKENLNKIIFDVNFRDYDQIQFDRKKSLSYSLDKQYLISRNEVKAKIRYNKKKLSANIRLKGDRADHWKNNKRLSLMVDIENSDSLNGYQRFSITSHSRRAFPQNEVISNALSKIGVIVPTFKTFRVKFNGQNWGQMYAEEQFSSSFYENRKLKESPIVKFTNSKDSIIPVILAKNDFQRSYFEDILGLQGVYEINVYKEKKFSKDRFNLERIFFLKHFNYYLKKKNLSNYEKKKIIDYMKVEKFAAVYAINSLFNDWHSTAKENIRFYLNPFDLKIEPIPTDFVGQSFINNFGKINNFQDFKIKFMEGSDFISILYEDKKFQENYFEYLNYFYKNLYILKNNIKELCSYENKSCTDAINFENLQNNYKLILRNRSNIFSVLDNYEKEDKLDAKNIFNKIEKYGSKKISEKINNLVFSRLYQGGELIIDNLVYFPLEIRSLRIKNESNNKCDINKNLNKNISPKEKLTLKLNDQRLLKCFENTVKYEIDIVVNNQLKTQEFYVYPEKFKDDFFISDQTKFNLNNLDYQVIKNDIIINEGLYHIQSPIILSNKNLVINAGTKLLFDKNSFIKINNGNLIINGEENNKVYLEAYDKYWNGLYVNNSKESKISHAVVKDLDFFNDNLFINLTGGINFYKSNLIVDYLKISDVISEDAINLTHSKVYLNNLQIMDTKSDGADLDFCTGDINEFSSNNIYGDGLDFSGSTIKITGGNLNNTIDKAISIGENSNIDISGIYVKNANIGIAIKDKSVAHLKNNFFINNKKDIDMYMKKSYYKYGGTLFISKKQKNKLKISKDNLSLINFVD